MDLLDRFLAQMGIVQAAWMPFLLALFLAAVIIATVIWKIVQWQHGVRITNLSSQLELYREASTMSAASSAATASEAKAEPAKSALEAPGRATHQPKRASSERVFFDDSVTLQTLRDLGGKGTTIAGQLATAAYSGKWMKIEGAVENVISGGDNLIMVVVREENRDPYSIPTTSLFFHNDLDRIQKLEAGEAIKAVGRFEKRDALALAFNNCELLDD